MVKCISGMSARVREREKANDNGMNIVDTWDALANERAEIMERQNKARIEGRSVDFVEVQMINEENK